jgi:tight adherence protein B
MPVQDDLSSLRLMLALLCGFTMLTAIFALLTWYRYQSAVQDALKRSQQVGADRAARRRGSIFLRLSDRYDESEAAERVQRQLTQANFKLKPSEYMAIRITGGVIAFAILYRFVNINIYVAAVLAILLAVYVPPLYLRSQRKRYLNAFNYQLVEATEAMASGIRAGLSVPQAIDQMSRKIPAPAGPEFRQLSREINFLGVSVETSLDNTLRRLPSEDLSVVVATLLIQRQAGGNLVKALSQLSEVMRERHEIRKEIDTMTAEVRYSAYIITLLPIVVVIFLRNMVPELVEPLFTHPAGIVILVMFLAAQFVAFILIRRVANIKV